MIEITAAPVTDETAQKFKVNGRTVATIWSYNSNHGFVLHSASATDTIGIRTRNLDEAFEYAMNIAERELDYSDRIAKLRAGDIWS